MPSRAQLSGLGAFSLVLFFNVVFEATEGHRSHRQSPPSAVDDENQSNGTKTFANITTSVESTQSKDLQPNDITTTPPPAQLPIIELTERQLWELSIIEELTKKGQSSDSNRTAELQRCYTLYEGGCISKATGSKQKSYTPYIKPSHGSDTISITVPHKESIVKSPVCNEGEARRVPLVGRSDFSPSSDPNTKVLIVTLCWDTYGYHLWNCVLGTHAVALMHALNKEDIHVAVLKSTWANHRFDNSEWKDSSQQVLWSIVAKDYTRVKSLRDFAGSCFKKMIVGHIPLFDITPSQNLAARSALLSNLNINNPFTDGNRRDCKNKWNSVIIERKSNFHIQNLDEVQNMLSEVSTNVTISRLEELPFREQVRLVSSSDIVVGTHGNGLTWVTLMYHGVLIEVWGQYPYNANYEGMAKRGNNRYIAISLHQPGCSKRCDITIPRNMLQPSLSLAVSHLHNVSCSRKWYDPDTLSNMFDELQISKGLKKRKRNKGMGSPPYLETSNL
eukprot:TRINITY_DN11228_c0_g1_i1.p1 TRINITY_DN11228_c0_g1~~TRINITY_DN11228_c0_g1_i1.p1  ORF type:complete len:503 (+),score=102.30 TRINITY_DN11228_c0_g1_i1:54-1562(+)